MFQFWTGITNGEKRIPDQGREGIKWSALKQGTHSALSFSPTGKDFMLAWCEMWTEQTKRKDTERESVCIAMCVCVLGGTLWVSQTPWSQDQQDNTDLIMLVHLSGKKTAAVSRYHTKDLLVIAQV